MRQIYFAIKYVKRWSELIWIKHVTYNIYKTYECLLPFENVFSSFKINLNFIIPN